MPYRVRTREIWRSPFLEMKKQSATLYMVARSVPLAIEGNELKPVSQRLLLRNKMIKRKERLREKKKRERE